MDENSKVVHQVCVTIVVTDEEGSQTSRSFGFTLGTTKTTRVAMVGEALQRSVYSNYIACLQQLNGE